MKDPLYRIEDKVLLENVEMEIISRVFLKQQWHYVFKGPGPPVPEIELLKILPTQNGKRKEDPV